MRRSIALLALFEPVGARGTRIVSRVCKASHGTTDRAELKERASSSSPCAALGRARGSPVQKCKRGKTAAFGQVSWTLVAAITQQHHCSHRRITDVQRPCKNILKTRVMPELTSTLALLPDTNAQARRSSFGSRCGTEALSIVHVSSGARGLIEIEIKLGLFRR